MKLDLEIVARRPLGRLLADLLDRFAREPFTEPRAIGLFSRRGRTDLPREEILAAAAGSASDTCVIQVLGGEISIRWFYGPKAHGQTLRGRIDVSPGDFPRLRVLLLDLWRITGGIYGYCDKVQVVDADVQLVKGMLLREQSFVGLYWFNAFGLEFRDELPLDDEVRSLVTELPDGSLVVVLGETPADKSPEVVEALARKWPVFEKHRPGTRFRKRVEIDYSEVRALGAPQSRIGTIGSIVAPADEFIRSVPQHAERFLAWIESQEGCRPATEQELLDLLPRHEARIRDEKPLLLGAIAAYGELVRARTGGAWREDRLLHRGEPVVGKPGRPWGARRVVLELMEGLEGVEL